jgi:hypothetical protein
MRGEDSQSVPHDFDSWKNKSRVTFLNASLSLAYLTTVFDPTV